MLPVERAQAVSERTANGAHPRSSLSPTDPRQDRTLPPLNEERGEAGELLLSVGTGKGHCRVGRALQSRAIPRVFR